MLEFERTFLAKYLPDLSGCKYKEIIDIYIPKDDLHPKLRIRKNGDSYEATKKKPAEDDPSVQIEQTIKLTKKEFEVLSGLEGRKVHKLRYYYSYNDRVAEVDIFQSELKGLVLVDFEFSSIEEKEKFVMPDFCLAEVTHEDFVAGGILCGKGIADIQPRLTRYKYSIILDP